PTVRRSFPKLLALGLALASAAACSDPEPESPPPAPEGAEVEAQLELLGDLGYTEYADSTGALPSEAGLVFRDAAASWPGYDLITSNPGAITELVAPDGSVVKTWSGTGSTSLRAELLANGDLLQIGRVGEVPNARRYLVRLDWNGRELWRRDIDAHHDFEITPAGEILIITNEYVREGSGRPMLSDRLTLLSPDGEVLREVSLRDAILAAPEILPLHVTRDLLHTNSVASMHVPELADRHPIYGPDRVLVSLRNQNAIAVVDVRQGRIVWAWGRGEILQQHDASLLPGGHILLFDNGDASRRWSRVVELDPIAGRIAWEYRAPRPEDFYSRFRGTAQALPNGNVLIGSSDQGVAFEVTREGRTV
ncbi:MAG TPA: arylsulfotransferase family protein, partial [Actinomycetota bacterium]|nr:arylsulfotransferase family protein [Actinomycetota bacterium]